MNVDQLMSRNVKTCSPTSNLEMAARIMWENDCGIVPVVDDQGRVLSMLTDRDICMAAYLQGQQLWQIPVSSAASKTLYAVRPTQSVQAAEELMRSRQVRRLAVTNDAGQLMGILSLNDIALRAGQRAGGVSVDEVSQTLSAICQHPGPQQPRVASTTRAA